jgi:hypothetical protein
VYMRQTEGPGRSPSRAARLRWHIKKYTHYEEFAYCGPLLGPFETAETLPVDAKVCHECMRRSR